jgi:hypothetical protein
LPRDFEDARRDDLPVGRPLRGGQEADRILLAEDGTAINFPKALLPKGAKAGDLLTLQIERDAAATKNWVARR